MITARCQSIAFTARIAYADQVSTICYSLLLFRELKLSRQKGKLNDAADTITAYETWTWIGHR